MDQSQLLEYMIDVGPMVIFRRTADDEVTYVSSNVERVLGYTQQEVLGTPLFWTANVHPEDRKSVEASAQDAFNHRASEFERDYRFLHKDGTYCRIRALTHIVYDEGGAATELLGYALDVTDRRAAEEQNAKLWAFPLALIFIAGLDGYFKRVSAGYERLLGWTEHELLSRPFFEFVHPDDLDVLGASLQEVMTGRTEVINQEIRVLCRDGTYRWLTGNYRPVLDEGLMYGMAVDITERRKAEEALRENERRVRLILDTAYEAFISMDAGGRIVDWNAQAERVFGWSREEIIGRLLAETIIPERYRAAHVRGLAHYLSTSEGPLLGRRVEIEALRRDGSEFPVELTISPTPQDHSVVFNAFLRDVTERKRSEDALRDANTEAARAREEAESANRAKSDFLSRMSHELRTPLNVIIGFSQLLETEELADAHHESIKRILRAGRHLLELINEILDIAAIEQGRVTLSIEAVHLGQVARDSLDLIRPLAESANIAIQIDTKQFDRHVLADRQRLTQVLVNLLSNAVKYNSVGGTVIVACETAPSGRVKLVVTDSGPGIPAEATPLLFVPFERLGAERTTVEGTGIGLSICKRLVELMGGEIGVESEIGRGSRFWVELDQTESPLERAVPTEDERSATPTGSGEGRTVLYVEDNLSNLHLVEMILARRPGTRLIAAMQGGMAAELAHEHRPDLILLDIHLPDIEGDEVLRRLREDSQTRHIPVIAVSAEATPGKIKRFLAAGARAYLTKPLDVTQFLEVFDGVLAETK